MLNHLSHLPSDVHTTGGSSLDQMRVGFSKKVVDKPAHIKPQTYSIYSFQWQVWQVTAVKPWLF